MSHATLLPRQPAPFPLLGPRILLQAALLEPPVALACSHSSRAGMGCVVAPTGDEAHLATVLSALGACMQTADVVATCCVGAVARQWPQTEHSAPRESTLARLAQRLRCPARQARLHQLARGRRARAPPRPGAHSSAPAATSSASSWRATRSTVVPLLEEGRPDDHVHASLHCVRWPSTFATSRQSVFVRSSRDGPQF